MLRLAPIPLALLAFGCDSILAHTGDEGMIILGNTALASGSTTCTFTGQLGQPYISSGQINTATNAGYLFNPLLQSNITAPMGSELIKTITLTGADVALTVESVTMSNIDTNAPITPPTITLASADSAFQALFGGTLPPNEGTSNVSFPIIPLSAINSIYTQAAPTASEALNVTVEAHITVYGNLGGSRIDALPFDYPVTVCNDCVIDIAGNCPVMTAAAAGNPCNQYQDIDVECCLSPDGSGEELLCGSNAPTGSGT
jgi:hypothetical protein